MRVVRDIRQMQAISLEARREAKSIGFVPTMGFLHEGHLSLIRQAKIENDFCIISVFVNPTQFGPEEDFKKYPRNFKRDAKLAKQSGVDIVFHPLATQMYPKGSLSQVNVSGLSEILCGKARLGHFKGVTTVVSKLFNIILPDKAYFGRKDFQQARIIQRMAEELNFPIKIKIMPIIREKDGLAMSSRNFYLSRRQRQDALILYRSLEEARRLIRRGCRRGKIIISTINSLISTAKFAKIDYIQIVDAKNLKPLTFLKGQVAILLAVRIGSIRLIDNIVIKL